VLPVKNTGKKRSSEGNSPNINSFSCLDTAYIIARSIGMGVNLGNNDFDAVNLLSELEHARLSLNKKSITLVNDQSVNEKQGSKEHDSSHLECVEEENTDYEDVIVTPKRIRKPNRKFLFSAFNKKSSKPAKENPGRQNGGIHQGISGASKKTPSNNNKKKSNHERSNMEL